MASTRKTAPELATRSELAMLRAELRRLTVTVADYAAQIERNRHDHEVVFARMAQLQAELDAIKLAWQQVSSSKKQPTRGERKARLR